MLMMMRIWWVSLVKLLLNIYENHEKNGNRQSSYENWTIFTSKFVYLSHFACRKSRKSEEMMCFVSVVIIHVLIFMWMSKHIDVNWVDMRAYFNSALRGETKEIENVEKNSMHRQIAGGSIDVSHKGTSRVFESNFDIIHTTQKRHRSRSTGRKNEKHNSAEDWWSMSKLFMQELFFIFRCWCEKIFVRLIFHFKRRKRIKFFISECSLICSNDDWPLLFALVRYLASKVNIKKLKIQ